MNTWPRKVMEWRRGRGRFTKGSDQTLEQYEMAMVDVGMEKKLSVRGRTCEGNPQAQSRKIRKVIEEKKRVQWKRKMEEKSTLRHYKQKREPKREDYYDGGWEGTLLFRARTDTLEVNRRSWRRGLLDDPECQKCRIGRDQTDDETLEHFIMECPWYEEIRQEFIEEVIETAGREEWEAESSEEDQGLGWLLGLRNPSTRVTNIMKKYLSKMWTRRKVPGRAQLRNVDYAYGERVE